MPVLGVSQIRSSLAVGLLIFSFNEKRSHSTEANKQPCLISSGTTEFLLPKFDDIMS